MEYYFDHLHTYMPRKVFLELQKLETQFNCISHQGGELFIDTKIGQKVKISLGAPKFLVTAVNSLNKDHPSSINNLDNTKYEWTEPYEESNKEFGRYPQLDAMPWVNKSKVVNIDRVGSEFNLKEKFDIAEIEFHDYVEEEYNPYFNGSLLENAMSFDFENITSIGIRVSKNNMTTLANGKWAANDITINKNEVVMNIKTPDSQNVDLELLKNESKASRILYISFKINKSFSQTEFLDYETFSLKLDGEILTLKFKEYFGKAKGLDSLFG